MQLILNSAENGFIVRRSTSSGPDLFWIAATIAAAVTVISEQAAIPDAEDEADDSTTSAQPPAPGGAKRGRKPKAETLAAGSPAAGPGPAVSSTPLASVAAVNATAAAPDLKTTRDTYRAFCRAAAGKLATVGGPAKIAELNGGKIDDMDAAKMAAAQLRIQGAIDALTAPAKDAGAVDY